MAHFRRRKNSIRETLKRRRSLVYFLEKGIGQLQDILKVNQGNGMDLKDFARLAVVKKVLVQQRFLLTNPPAELKNRIVSMYKPYLRPIVRGKENKPVEFGAKAHILQVDGLTFIDKLDLNESCQLPNTKGSSVLPNSSGRTGSMPQTTTGSSVQPTKYLPVFPKKAQRNTANLKKSSVQKYQYREPQ